MEEKREIKPILKKLKKVGLVFGIGIIIASTVLSMAGCFNTNRPNTPNGGIVSGGETDDPVTPADPVIPVEPGDEIEPVDPTPVDPVIPVEPIEPGDEIEPVDPGEIVEPVDPVTPVAPVEELDFSGLENKIVETAKNVFISEATIYLYGIKENKLYAFMKNSAIDYPDPDFYLYSVPITTNLDTQEDIDALTSSLKMSDWTQEFYFGLQSDFEVEGVRYAGDGIEGSNPFAESIDISNPIMTWVGSCPRDGTLTDSTPTHYCTAFSTACLYEENGEYKIVVAKQYVVCNSTVDVEQAYIDAYTNSDKLLETRSTVYNLGSEIQGEFFENLNNELSK